MKNIITIIKKEFTRFFKDKRLVFTTLILPGLMIFLIYSFMGDAINNMQQVDTDYMSPVYVYQLPPSLQDVMEQLNVEFLDTDTTSIEEAKQKIVDKEADLLVIFPEDFDALVADYDINNPAHIAPNVEMFFNSTKTTGQSTYILFTTILNQYEDSIANKFDINNSLKDYDLASNKDIVAQLFSNMLPMLMLIFVFSGCMAIAPESIAGEKERGTMATLLVTPINRNELAVGKIFSLGFIALLGGLSSFLGTILSLPKMMGSGVSGVGGGMYLVSDYLMLLGVILSTVMVVIAALSVISAYAKNIKEANTLIAPFMLVTMIVGVTSMFKTEAAPSFAVYLIPLYNSVQTMMGIFSFSANLSHVLITIFSNIVYTTLMAIVLAKMFNSEKVMFSK